MIESPASSPLNAEGCALEAFNRLATPQVAIFEHCVRDYLQNDGPEVGHQLRVAVRRLRTLLWAYRWQFPEGLADEWRRRFRDVDALIGPARDWDVIVNILLREGLPSSEPTARILLKSLEQASDEARTASRVTLASVNPERLVSSFREAVSHVVASQEQCGGRLGELVQVSIAKASKRAFKSLDRAKTGGMHELHDVRIQIKRLRYLLEFFSPLLRSSEVKRIHRLQRLQDALGSLNDVVVGASYLSEVPAAPQYAIAHTQFMEWLTAEQAARRCFAVAALRGLSRYAVLYRGAYTRCQS